MIFQSLYEAALKGELILIEGGLCHYHIRKNGQLTVNEIISTQPGAGRRMLDQLKQMDPRCIVAKCPMELESNAWWKRQGFELIREERTRSTNKGINVWCLYLKSDGFGLR